MVGGIILGSETLYSPLHAMLNVFYDFFFMLKILVEKQGTNVVTLFICLHHSLIVIGDRPLQTGFLNLVSEDTLGGGVGGWSQC